MDNEILIEIPAKYIDYDFFENLQGNGTLKNTVDTLKIKTLSQTLGLNMDIFDIPPHKKTEHVFLFALGSDAADDFGSHDNCKVSIYGTNTGKDIALFDKNIVDYVGEEGLKNPILLMQVPSREAEYYGEYAVYDCEIKQKTLFRNYYAKKCKVSEFEKIDEENKEIITIVQFKCEISPKDAMNVNKFNQLCIYSSLFLDTALNVPASIPYDAGKQKSGFHINAIPIFDISFEDVVSERITENTEFVINAIKGRRPLNKKNNTG